MPFMKGREPVRRTLQYLKNGTIVLKDTVRIFSVNYNTNGNYHAGAKDFVFLNLPQIQFRNPEVQVLTLKNKTPSPFVHCYLDDGRDIVIDIDNRNREQIIDHLINIVGKTREELCAESRMAESKDNPASFGCCSDRHCSCEIPGQAVCCGTTPLPNNMRGKFTFAPK